VPIQSRYGWRASFYIFGLVGVAWAAAWFFLFRNTPGEKPGVTPAELGISHTLYRRFAQGSYSITGRLSSVRQWAESGLASGPTI
jgi:predicted MFS family arabinose efflux permease